MKAIWTYFWHFLVVALLLAVIASAVGLWHGAEFHTADDITAYKVGDEGPHVFQDGGQWVARTLRGGRETGFWVEEQRHALTDRFQFDVAFPLDDRRFTVTAQSGFQTPPTRYQDGQPILAISDIEGSYKTFREFLIKAKVIDAELNWTFGQGHLVLVGDFVDRGASTTQVLWFIYGLEQRARQQGGQVHYILGNHELKNLHGDLQAAHKKYAHVAAILGKPQAELFGDSAFLGQWMMSKNTAEVINGTLFVHGGLHPELAERAYTLDDLNQIVRSHYRTIWYPKRERDAHDLLLNTKTGPSWYRGYFKDGLTQAQVERTLAKFEANAVVVGHTPTWHVKPLFEKKVFAIDVKHPLDYRGSFPPRRSEGLRLADGNAWRVLDDGSQEPL